MEYSQKSIVGHCGIKNLGNTCFLNSILQLLLHCTPVVIFLLKQKINKKKRDALGNYIIENGKPVIEQKFEGFYRENVEENIRKSLIKKGIINEMTMTDDANQLLSENLKDTMSYALSDIINKIYYIGNGRVEPNELKRILGNKNKRFRNFNQEDSHEAIHDILELIYDETGCTSEPIIENIPEVIIKFNDERSKLRKESQFLLDKADIQGCERVIKKIRNLVAEFYSVPNNLILMKQHNGLVEVTKYYSKQYNSLIRGTNIFTINTIKCLECDFEKHSFERHKTLDITVKNTIEESLKAYTNGEIIENYTCDNCKECCKIQKQTKIWENPQILFIYIKKYEYKIKNGKGYFLKNNEPMSISDTIDISEYCDSANNGRTSSKKYVLKGYSSHSGSGNGGHYTADCRCPIDNKSWYNYNDSSFGKYINAKNSEDLDTSNAYVLMYEQITF